MKKNISALQSKENFDIMVISKSGERFLNGRYQINYITMDTKQAFTIWELICVLVVVVLLIALLMPALSRVRRGSTRVVCLSYLHQYSMVGQLYLNANGNLFPEETNEWLYTKASVSEFHPIGCRWHDRAMSPTGRIMHTSQQYQGKMWSYIGPSTIGPCPTFRRFARSIGCENPNHNKDLDIEPQYSYTMNGYLGNKQVGGVLRVDEVRDPSKVFFFAEENSWSLRPDHSKFPARYLTAPLSTKALDNTVLLIRPTPQTDDCFATYHNAPSKDLNRGYGNVLFIDGHVEAISAEDQLRKHMHGGNSRLGPAGNLSWAWASTSPPPGGWDAQ